MGSIRGTRTRKSLDSSLNDSIEAVEADLRKSIDRYKQLSAVCEYIDGVEADLDLKSQHEVEELKVKCDELESILREIAEVIEYKRCKFEMLPAVIADKLQLHDVYNQAYLFLLQELDLHVEDCSDLEDYTTVFNEKFKS